MPNKDITYKDKPIKELDDTTICYYLTFKDLLCDYCPYNDHCNGISSNSSGEPIYPVCNEGGENFHKSIADIFKDVISEDSENCDLTLNQLEEKGVL